MEIERLTAKEFIWSTILSAIPDVGAWNQNLPELKRLAEQYGPECKKYIADEAEKRGYMWSKTDHKYVKVGGIIDEASEVPKVLSCDRGASAVPGTRRNRRMERRGVQDQAEAD